MQDPITELPPPSRFHASDLNNFATPDKSLSLPRPFVAWTRTLVSPPKLLLIALSKAACHLVHHLPSKTLIGTLVLPEISMSENTIETSVEDKSCLLYSPKGDSTVMLASVQYVVSAERAVVWAKALLREVRPEAVVIASSIPSMHFRGTAEDDAPIDLDEIDPESEWIAADDDDDDDFLDPDDLDILMESNMSSELLERVRTGSDPGASSSRPTTL